MPVPTVLSVVPANNETDVVLGLPITVAFDTLMDHTTINDSTFSITGPGQTMTITPAQLIAQDPESVTGREYITGTFAFDDSAGYTVVTFNPNKIYQQNGAYTVLLLGNDGVLSSDSIKSSTGTPMPFSYRWKFTAGDVNVFTPPSSSPLPALVTRIDPNSITVTPRPSIGNNLAQEIDIIFPADIDQSSFNLQDILTSISPILGDPSVQVPSGLSSSIVIVDNKIKITITGW